MNPIAYYRNIYNCYIQHIKSHTQIKLPKLLQCIDVVLFYLQQQGIYAC